MKNVIIPDIDVAKARPASFKGNMSIVFKTIFRIKLKDAIFVGVTVSFKAKKQDCNIFLPP